MCDVSFEIPCLYISICIYIHMYIYILGLDIYTHLCIYIYLWFYLCLNLCIYCEHFSVFLEIGVGCSGNCFKCDLIALCTYVYINKYI